MPELGKVEAQELGWPKLCLQYLVSLTMVLELMRPLTMGMENGIDQAILTVYYGWAHTHRKQVFSVHFPCLKVVLDTMYKTGPPVFMLYQK